MQDKVKKAGRPTTIPYGEISKKFITGQYSISRLARDYGVSKSCLSEYFKKNNIMKDERAKEAIEHLNKGFGKLTELMQSPNDDNKGFSNTENKIIEQNRTPQNREVADEVLDIVKDKNPLFAKMLQNISIKILKNCSQISDGVMEPKDIKNITSSMKDINDMLQVIPRMPTIQNNIQNNISNNQNNNLGIKIEFVEHNTDKIKEKVKNIIEAKEL